MNDYLYKTEPFDHQDLVFKRSRDMENFALFMEQGTGKSKVIIDTAAWLYLNGKIDCVIIVAPKGVHQNWHLNEIPKHMPDYIEYISRCWMPSKTNTKKHLDYIHELFEPQDKLRIFEINIDGVSSIKGKVRIASLLNSYRCLLVIDESHLIKNWNIKRSKTLVALGKKALYRRILTGTPLTQGPTDIYGQFRFLDTTLLGYSSFYAFQARFTVMVDDIASKKQIKDMTESERKQVFLLKHLKTQRSPYINLPMRNEDGTIQYKRLDELYKLIKPHSFRVTKDECLDLPPRLYKTIYIDLSKEQRKYYNDLKNDLMIEINSSERLTTPLILTQMLRLRQIIGGNLPLDSGKRISLDCPRFKLLKDICEGTEGKVIIWAYFTNEITEIARLFDKDSYVTYYGATLDDDRPKNVKLFQNESSIKYFISNPQAGGTGIDLFAANTVIYYSNNFSLTNRLQSEGRAHRHGLKGKVTYIDFIANDTIDSHIIAALQNKQEMANLITRDNLRRIL